MKVDITYYDHTSLTMEEVVREATNNYGDRVEVTVSPESAIGFDYIYFGLQQILTHKQISLIFEKHSEDTYNSSIKKLRQDAIDSVVEIVDQVIHDNEAKVK